MPGVLKYFLYLIQASKSISCLYMLYKIKRLTSPLQLRTMLAIPALRRLRYEVWQKFEANLGYTMGPSFKATTTHKEPSLFPIKTQEESPPPKWNKLQVSSSLCVLSLWWFCPLILSRFYPTDAKEHQSSVAAQAAPLLCFFSYRKHLNNFVLNLISWFVKNWTFFLHICHIQNTLHNALLAAMMNKLIFRAGMIPMSQAPPEPQLWHKYHKGKKSKADLTCKVILLVKSCQNILSLINTKTFQLCIC